jgi:hypothetical protein
MFDKKEYWGKKVARQTVAAMKSTVNFNTTMKTLRMLFTIEPQVSGQKKDKSPKGHTRSQSVRRIRRQKHQTMLRSVRG